MKPYDHKKIEKKWQKAWDEKKVYQTLNAKQAKAKKLKPYYVLDMFPYPSGAGLHVGHPRGYIASDVFARMKRMQGYNVLHPMGFDSFGLPAEQYAIKTGKNPGPFTNQLVKRYREQLSILGFSFDWDRQVNTHDPEYYRWTQWIFLQIYNSYYDEEKQKARPIAELVKKFEKTDKSWKNLSEIEQQNILMKYRLAYEGYAEVNWCAELGTVLANDEIIEKDGKMVSERGEHPVVKKQMRQWFMRITAYADRLINGLDTIDWPHSIKEIQRNWIGKSEGSEISFELKNSDEKITVFTTRADTLFGVTYVVLAPEHELVQKLKPQIKNWNEVEKYLADVKAKSDEDRVAAKEKTGVELTGVFAVNPANGEQVPVWIADYVLATYGTGAVMAVPAHDERDFEFAKKYSLPMVHVVESLDINRGPHNDAYREGIPVVERNNVVCVIEHPTEDKYLCAVWKQVAWKGFVTGGIEEGVSLEDTVRQEIREETGYKNIAKVTEDGRTSHGLFYHVVKNQNRLAHYRIMHVKLADLEREEPSAEELAIADFVWVAGNSVSDFLMRDDMRYPWKTAREKSFVHTNLGILAHSGKFSGMRSEDGRIAITESVGGKLVTKYKMRDAIFARQRYWGEPIPLVYGKDGAIKPVSEKNLPLTLPNVKSYAPTGDGQSPLAGVKSWVNAGYETNTMPGWAGSSWYFLRYADPKNKKAIAGESELDYWFGKNGGVNMYVGGAEHATGHLLYSRFWHKVLKDLGHVTTEEPFQALRNQGMIGGTDGRKMSKRWGNVINPDDVVRDLGADTMRVYEAFMGPFEASLPWSTDGIVGSRRFIERVWKLQSKVSDQKSSDEVVKVLHKTIKKVNEDIPSFGFNTAVSAMMIFLNAAEKAESVSSKDFKLFLQILAPFAPHVTDELWSILGEKNSIHRSPWPTHNPKLVVEDSVTIGVQVNGKVRAEISLAKDAPESDVRSMVMQIPEIVKWVDGKDVRKFIYVPGKIISIVV